MYFDALAASLFVQQWLNISGGVGLREQDERHALAESCKISPAPPLFFLAQR